MHNKNTSMRLIQPLTLQLNVSGTKHFEHAHIEIPDINGVSIS